MKFRIFCCFLAAITFINSSIAQLTTLPDGGNKKAWIGERIGITDVIIHYSRPGVKGREGKIWGQLVHAGYKDLGFGTSKAAPWRAGANENTTIEFSTDVKIEGQQLPSGKYAFFIAWDATEPTLIFSKNSSSWGSYFYNDIEDALRIKVKSIPSNNSVEYLKYEFTNQTENSATIALLWEKMMIPFKIEVDYINTQLQAFRNELRGERSFNPGWQSYQQAAQFTIDRNISLDEGLKWSNQAINDPFVGEINFITLSTQAQILSKLGRNLQADSVMKKALPLGTMQQVHAYGRQLLSQKKNKEALEIFKMNYAKYPNQFATLMGLTRGYSASNDFKNALKYAKMALPLAPAGQNKTFVEEAIKKLEEGKDIN